LATALPAPPPPAWAYHPRYWAQLGIEAAAAPDGAG
jgi:hypothetical protein